MKSHVEAGGAHTLELLFKSNSMRHRTLQKQKSFITLVNHSLAGCQPPIAEVCAAAEAASGSLLPVKRYGGGFVAGAQPVAHPLSHVTFIEPRSVQGRSRTWHTLTHLG